jgi:transposase
VRVILSHGIALVPSAAQEILLRQAVGVSRFSYNWALTEWQRQYQHDRDTNASTNLRCYAVDRASCAQINACGKEGSGAGPLGWRETGLVETGISPVLFGHGFEQRSQ